MRAMKKSLVTAFIVAATAVAIGTVYVNRVVSEEARIDPVRLDRTLDSYCEEVRTTNEFGDFLRDFRSAVASDDKKSLWSMVEKCRFWWETPAIPLKLGNCTLTITADCEKRWPGSPQIFLGFHDFESAYDKIFSPDIKQRILANDPWQSAHGYSISWEADGGAGTSSILFYWTAGVGYKYSGVEWVPDSVEAVKFQAKQARDSACPQPDSFP